MRWSPRPSARSRPAGLRGLTGARARRRGRLRGRRHLQCIPDLDDIVLAVNAHTLAALERALRPPIGSPMKSRDRQADAITHAGAPRPRLHWISRWPTRSAGAPCSTITCRRAAMSPTGTSRAAAAIRLRRGAARRACAGRLAATPRAAGALAVLGRARHRAARARGEAAEHSARRRARAGDRMSRRRRAGDRGENVGREMQSCPP